MSTRTPNGSTAATEYGGSTRHGCETVPSDDADRSEGEDE